MSNSERFHVPNPNLIHDTIEGEVILLNLDTGTYYQVRGTGVWVWDLLVAGVPLPEIATRLRVRYPNDAEAIESGLEKFVKELEQEEIISPLNSDAPMPANLPATDTGTGPSFESSFDAPVLLKYTDMQSLLLLDPIHDVDTPGWPISKGTEKAG